MQSPRAFASSDEAPFAPDASVGQGSSSAGGMGVLQIQRIDRTVRVPSIQEQKHTPGIPFVPPDPDRAAELADPQLQVIELEGDGENPDGEDQPAASTRLKKVDPTADLTLRDYIFFVFDGFPGRLYRKRTVAWIRVSDVVNNFMLIVVLLSCFSFSTESLPQYYDRNLDSFNVIEAFCIAVFTLDIVVRVTLTRENIKFIKSVQNWVDFISILPFYLGVILGSDTGSGALVMLRVLRLMRVFRILKLTKRSVGLQAVIEAMLQSTEAISLLSFLLMIATVLFSSAMFFAEQTGATFDERRQLWIRDDGTVSPFQSIFHTMWWCVVTMTTVGYGDDVPVTPLGKVVGSITMLCGVFVLAFPTVILSTNFQEVHQAKVEQNKQLTQELQEIEREMNEDDEDDEEAKDQVPIVGTTPIEGAEAEAVDPRFAALVDKLQDNYSKYTRFGYKFNPYVERKASNLIGRVARANQAAALQDSQHGSPRAPEEQQSTRFAAVTFAADDEASEHDHNSAAGQSQQSDGGWGSIGRGGGTGADVEMTDTKMHRERSQPRIIDEDEPVELIADVDKVVEGVIQVVDNEVAVFTPALYFEATDSNHLYARVETVPGSENQLLTLHLVIDTTVCKAMVERAITRYRPDDFFMAIPRPVKRLQLRLETEYALLREVRLITTMFDMPMGTVPVALLVPNTSVLSILLHNLRTMRFMARCYFDDPVAVKEPLVRYGGVLLQGDAFDDEAELQLFVADEDERRKDADLHGEAQSSSAFGRRASNYIRASGGGGGSGEPPSTTWSKTVQGSTTATAEHASSSPPQTRIALGGPALQEPTRNTGVGKQSRNRGATPVPHRGSTPMPTHDSATPSTGGFENGSGDHGGDLAIPRASFDDEPLGDDPQIPVLAVGAHIDLGPGFEHHVASRSVSAADDRSSSASSAVVEHHPPAPQIEIN